MLTPIERMHQEKLAAVEAETVTADRMEGMPEYDRLLLGLNGHRQHLSNLQGRDAKLAYKREVVPDYAAYVTGVLDHGNGAHDDILVTVLVWRIDTGDIQGALDIADYAIPQGLDSPDNFKRDLKNLVTEEISEYTLDNPDIEFGLEYLERLYLLVEELDMIDEVKATLNKALGILSQEVNLPEAIDYLKEALRLNDKCGVKGLLKKLEKQYSEQDREAAPVAQQAEPEPEKDTPPTEASKADQTE